MNGKSITAPDRRRLASRLGAVALIAAAAGQAPAAALAQTTIKFIAWNFQVETVNEFVKQFEAENPGRQGRSRGHSFGAIRGEDPTDEERQHALRRALCVRSCVGQWSSWLEPLDNYPGAAELKAKMLPLARQSMTYNGKLYGLPYSPAISVLSTTTRC